MSEESAKTTHQYWEGVHGRAPRMRLPSRLNVATADLQALLARYVRRGDRVLEIGFAPGKQLAYVAKVLGASVAGIDFSERGCDFARQLFDTLGIVGDLRCEDVFESTFEPALFDLVYSVGVIEHFDDPRGIVRKHVELLKPGGVAVILVPNYGGVYGQLQRYFDDANLSIHNLSIMSTPAMTKLVPENLTGSARAFSYGRLNGGLLSLEKRWPALISRATQLALNLAGMLQPFRVASISPSLVLEIRRAS